MRHYFLVNDIILMFSLKKALTKDDPKKYNRNKIQISSFKQPQKYRNIEEMLPKNSLKNYQGKSINDKFRRVIQGNYVNGEIRDVNKMYKELLEVYREFNQDEPASLVLHSVLDILKEMAKAEQGAVFKKYIETTCDKIVTHIKDKENREKKKCLEEFNKILKNTKGNPNSTKKEERPEINKALSKLVHSTSATNLKIRVTRDEYHIEDEHLLKRKKSLDFKNKSSKQSSNSNKNLSGSNKLQQFLKDTNVKLVKTKIEYDFSAIFEASNKNIQPRNKTAYIQPKNEKEIFTKASKGKRDQGFVFYRPKKH